MSDLSRFIDAQKRDYCTALSEIKSGRKRSHWMWYIFPQIAGLGFSPTAQYYAIEDLEEATQFINDQYLGKNLIEISKALLDNNVCDPEYVMGYPDNLKLCSCMTLFSQVSDNPVFKQVLDKYFEGKMDSKTLYPKLLY